MVVLENAWVSLGLCAKAEDWTQTQEASSSPVLKRGAMRDSGRPWRVTETCKVMDAEGGETARGIDLDVLML